MDDFVAVLFVDFVGDLFHVWAVKFMRWDLHQVRDGGEDEHCVYWKWRRFWGVFSSGSYARGGVDESGLRLVG